MLQFLKRLRSSSECSPDCTFGPGDFEMSQKEREVVVTVFEMLGILSKTV